MDIWLDASSIDNLHARRLASALRRHFRIVPKSGQIALLKPSGTGPVPLTITENRLPTLYRVTRERGVRVSAAECEGLSHYAGLNEGTYLLLCSLLGIIQYRVLQTNPLLVPEDFRHPSDPACLFSEISAIHDIALILDEPRICTGCVDFYHCLGADTELVALNETLEGIREALIDDDVEDEFGSDLPWDPAED